MFAVVGLTVFHEFSQLTPPSPFQMAGTTSLTTLDELYVRREQNMRGTLVERSLLATQNMCNKDVEMVLHECGTAKGKLMAVQSNSEHYIVKDVQLPSGTLPSAVIRMNDTITIGVDFDKLDQPPFAKNSAHRVQN
uniref:General secretion pathway protein C n=1 Tax=Steinernema glaseri TaxID=37863 RepID=A0A1I7Y465_9BILA